jgi:hypothetical protein
MWEVTCQLSLLHFQQILSGQLYVLLQKGIKRPCQQSEPKEVKDSFSDHFSGSRVIYCIPCL